MQNQLLSFDIAVVCMNTDKRGGRTTHSSGSFLHSHFLALLNLRGIEPRALFLQDSQTPGIDNSWWTPFEAKGPGLQNSCGKKQQGKRGSKYTTAVSGDLGRRGGPVSPWPGLIRHFVLLISLWIEE